MSEVLNFINFLGDKGIRIYLENGELKVNGDKSVFTEELVDRIGKNKADLKKYLLESYQSEILITPIAAQDSYELSHGQQRFWMMSQFDAGSLAFNMQSALLFEGDLDRDVLNKSFQYILARHEILHTVFKEDDNHELKQFVNPDLIFQHIAYEDLSTFEDQEFMIIKSFNDQQASSFAMEEGPLLRLKLLKLNDNKHVLLIMMHHIISDGWSMQVLSRELVLVYNSFKNKTEPSLLALRFQYKDFAYWQNSFLKSDRLSLQEKYWIQQFSDELPLLDIPLGKKRPVIKTYAGASVQSSLTLSQTKAFKALCSAEGATLYMGLLATLNTLLFRYTGQSDIVIGSPIAGREQPELQNQIGLYLNTLALRTRFTGRNSFIELIGITKKNVTEAYANQSYPFNILVEKLGLNRDMSRSPLFDVMCVLQNHSDLSRDQDTHALEGLHVSALTGLDKKHSQFDLTFEFAEINNVLVLTLNYNTDIYSKSDAEQLSSHYFSILEAATAKPGTAVEYLDYLMAFEKTQLLDAFNHTAIAYPNEKTIIDLFEDQVNQYPNEVALKFADVSWTYQELNEKSNQWAHYLRTNHFLKAGDLVGIMVERSEKMLIGMLAILKAGAAYIPIDPSYPQQRIEYIVSNSHLKLLLTDKVVQDFDSVQILLDETLLPAFQLENPTRLHQSSDLAYVIYTSGSTGNPKGVEVLHRGLTNFLHSMTNCIGVEMEERLLAITTFSFDIAGLELFLPIINGAQVILASKEESRDMDLLQQLIRKESPTIIQATPSFWKLLIDNNWMGGSHVKILCGGEKMQPDLAIALFNRSGYLWNMYGPTETTIWSTSKLITTAADLVSIGTPISNTEIYILDLNHQLVPIGVCGEICIGGDGLARGYLNQPELTREKFIPNPFNREKLIYRTGDIGKWMPDGNIECLGRIDDQVKIRGFRVELGEIEARILEQEKIGQTVVVAQKDKTGDESLVAFLVAETEVNVKELREQLSKYLPDYMIPGYFEQLPQLPLTPNGKIDRKVLALQQVKGILEQNEHIPPRNSIEQILVILWQDILERDNIGVTDNFFSLGGHSLKVTKILSKVKLDFSVKIDIQLFFENPTIESLAELIENAQWIKDGLSADFGDSHEKKCF